MTTPTYDERRAWRNAQPRTNGRFAADASHYATARNSSGHTMLGEGIERAFITLGDSSSRAAVDLDAMLTREDATAERGSLAWRIAGAVGSALVGAAFMAMVALTLWGWVG